MIFSFDGVRQTVFKIVAMMVVVCFSSMVFAQDIPKTKAKPSDVSKEDYLRGKSDGMADADQHYNPHRWRNGGFAGGFLLGIPGTVVTLVISQFQVPQFKEEDFNFIRGYSQEYQSGYYKGYLYKIRDKRAGPVLVGGLIGSIFSGAMVYAYLKAKQKPSRH